MFVFRENMPTLFKRDLTCQDCSGPGSGRTGGGPGPPGDMPGLRQPVGRTGLHDHSDKSAVLHEGGQQEEDQGV